MVAQAPKFTNPPISELVISVYFKALPFFQTAHYGKFWRRIEKDYPKTEDKDPIIISPFAAGIEAGVMPIPARRVFLISEDDNFLVQLQADFFAHNWRKIQDTDRYPGFDTLRDLFVKRWDAFNTFIEELGASSPKPIKIEPIRYEITYVNMFIENTGAFPLALAQYSPIISLNYAQADIPEGSSLKALQALLFFELPETLGQLQVAFKQGVRRTDQKEVMQFELTARTLNKPDELPNLHSWLDRAHECIGFNFINLTTHDAHEKWGRTQ